MKKIVSLALSTAMAFSMFASVTSAATLTTQEKYNALVTQGIFQGYPNGEAYLEKDMTRAEFAKVVALLTGLDTSATTTSTYSDKNYANAWYKPFVEAVTKAGYMQGTTTGAKKMFNPNGKVTVQEMAATLVRAAKLEVPTTGINNNASAWAKGEVQAAINAGLISATANFSGAATRGLLVDTAYAYQTATSKPTVDSSKTVVQDNGATVVFTLSNGEKVTVKPQTALQPNVATVVPFTYNGVDYKETVTWTLTTATQVTGASATNLKEIDVAFNGTVDATTASDVDRYSTTAGDIETATVMADGKTVRLTLEEGDVMRNQESYTVTVTGVKAGTATINSGAISFRPLDNVLPTVASVTGLGTSAVKVTFSEPVRNVTATNFTVNGAAYNGSVTMGATDREVILRPYTAFPVGTHTLGTSLIEDYNGLKSLSATNEFTVAVDNQGPTVTEIKATLERAVVTFSEEVDPNTVTASDFYWTAGTVNHQASTVKQIAGNVYEVNFVGNDRLPSYTTNLNIVSVADYSGNVNTVKQFAVNATVDQTRPTLTATSFNKTTQNVTLTFSKTVTANRANFTVTNASGTVIPVETATVVDGNKVEVDFVSENLGTGTYTVNISGVRDTTALENAIEPVSTTFVVGDTTAPTVVAGGVTANNANRTITVTFSEAMNPATLTDARNYVFTMNGETMRLPSSVSLRATNNNRSVVVTFPERIDNTLVTFASPTVTNPSVTALTINGVEDTSGNVLSGFTYNASGVSENTPALATAYNGDFATPAVQTGQRTLKVRFNQAIDRVAASDFALTGAPVAGTSITSAVVDSDGTSVTLTASADLGTDTSDLTLAIRANNSIRTVSGVSFPTTAAVPVALTDDVAPVIVASAENGLSFNGRVITVPFSEPLVAQANTAAGSDLARDLVVTNTVTGAVLDPTQYSATIAAPTADNSDIVITLAPSVTTVAKQYSVNIRNAATTIADDAGNRAVPATTPYVTAANQFVAAPTVTTRTTAVPATTGTATLTFNRALTTASQDAVIAALRNAATTGQTTTNLVFTFNSAGDEVTITNTSPTAYAPTSPVTATVTDAEYGNTGNVTLVNIP